MYVKPSNSTPAALRKARWEREQAAQAKQVKVNNAVSLAKVATATVRPGVSLRKVTDL